MPLGVCKAGAGGIAGAALHLSCCRVCNISSFSLFSPLSSPFPSSSFSSFSSSSPSFPYPLHTVPSTVPGVGQCWGHPQPHLRDVGTQDSPQAAQPRTALLRSPHGTREGSISTRKSWRFIYLLVALLGQGQGWGRPSSVALSPWFPSLHRGKSPKSGVPSLLPLPCGCQGTTGDQG